MGPSSESGRPLSLPQWFPVAGSLLSWLLLRKPAPPPPHLASQLIKSPQFWGPLPHIVFSDKLLVTCLFLVSTEGEVGVGWERGQERGGGEKDEGERGRNVSWNLRTPTLQGKQASSESDIPPHTRIALTGKLWLQITHSRVRRD